MSRKDPLCYACKKPATVLCDYTDASRKATGMEVCLSTCDRAMCDDHRVKVGHMCNRRKKSESTTIDYCLEHADEAKNR